MQVHSIGAACEPAMKNTGTTTSVADWTTSQSAAIGAAMSRSRAISSMYMNRCADLRPRRAIPEEYVERHRRSVRLFQVGRHYIAGDIDTSTESARPAAQHVTNVTDRYRPNLRLPMTMKRVGRMEAGIEDALRDRFGPGVHRCLRREAEVRFEQVRFEVAVDLAVLAERRQPRDAPVFIAGRIRQRCAQSLCVVRRECLRLDQPGAGDLSGPGSAVPRYSRGRRIEGPQVEIEPVFIGFPPPEP